MSVVGDSVISFHARFADPVNPVPGPSQGGYSILNFSHCLVGTSGSSPLVAVRAVGVRRGGWFWFLWGWYGSSLSLFGRLPSFSFLASASGSALPFATLVTQPSASVAQLSSPAFLPASSVTSSFPPVASFSSVFPSFPPPVALFSSLAPSLTPPGFPFIPPVRPLAPPAGLRPPFSSLVSAVVSLSLPVSALLLSGSSSSSSPLLPSYPLSTVVSQLHVPVSASLFLVVSSGSSPTVVSWSLPTVVTCSSPSVAYLSAPAHSLVPPVASLGSFFFFSSSCHFFSFCSPSSFAFSGVPAVPHSSLCISTGLGSSSALGV